MLTDNQRKIYDFLLSSTRQQGYPPTVREIGLKFKIKSPNGIACHLKALEKKGWITREKNKSRAVKFLDAAAPKTALPVVAQVRGDGLVKSKQLVNLSLCEIMAGDNVCLLIKTGAVSGSHDGDYLVIRPQAHYSAKNTVVWQDGRDVHIAECAAVPPETTILGRLIAKVRPY